MDRCIGLLALILLVLCLWLVDGMTEQLEDHVPEGPVLAGQRVEEDGVVTERWMNGDKPESVQVWVRRHQEGIAAQEGR